jgi:hypothetical protein
MGSWAGGQRTVVSEGVSCTTADGYPRKEIER